MGFDKDDCIICYINSGSCSYCPDMVYVCFECLEGLADCLNVNVGPRAHSAFKDYYSVIFGGDCDSCKQEKNLLMHINMCEFHLDI